MENGSNNNNDSNNNNNNSVASLVNLNNVANWVSATVISAFFSSLERFSCVNVATTDPDDDDDNEIPLALSTNPRQNDHDDNLASLPV
uniref:Uncharacterized protein n=1 Tax=Rhizophora mucronata TaxID=61149 RepID=A0A2P2PM76_RHIMU